MCNKCVKSLVLSSSDSESEAVQMLGGGVACSNSGQNRFCLHNTGLFSFCHLKAKLTAVMQQQWP